MVAYDGTIRALSRLYQQHADSPFHDVKRNTRKTYSDSLKVIENTVGNRLVRAVTVVDVKRWFKLWREPKVEGGEPRASRAHDAVSMLRTILRFGFALGYPDCAALVERLKMIRFENAGAREQEMTAGQAMAFIRLALGRGDDRGRNMAIGVAAQFELALRQKDIIGEWGPARPNVAGAVYADAEMWTGHFVGRTSRAGGYALRPPRTALAQNFAWMTTRCCFRCSRLCHTQSEAARS